MQIRLINGDNVLKIPTLSKIHVINKKTTRKIANEMSYSSFLKEILTSSSAKNNTINTYWGSV